MRPRTSLLAALTAATAAIATFGLSAPGASAALGTPKTAAGTGQRHRSGQLPRQVFAPYVETYDTVDGSPAQLSGESGAKYLSLAFLQTDQAGSCTAFWNGNTSTPISRASFGADIAAIQASGGNVIPSFGGFAADTTGTELADSCTSVGAIAKVFEDLITTYHVPRIDLDVEGTSITDTAGINRRNEAIARTQAWAAAHGRHIQFSYTLPTFPDGLTSDGLAVLQNAADDGARVSVVNLLTFDYFLGPQQDMVADTETAAAGLFQQLRTLHPAAAPQRLWRMIGVTEMPGIDDFGPAETFSTADAATVLRWARAKGIGTLSFWATQRDNGNCPGTKGAGACSGLDQPTWFFSHVFEPFTSRF
jgi:hypothetical protein